MDEFTRAADIISGLNRMTRVSQVIEAFAAFLRQFGVDYFALGDLVIYDRPNAPTIPMAEVRYPVGWFTHYIERSYSKHDGLPLAALRSRRPFFWHDIRPYQQGIAARIFDDARAFNLLDGYCVPIHHPGRFPALANFIVDRDPLSPAAQNAINLACFAVVSRIDELHQPDGLTKPPKLSNRERDVLHWIAAGKSIPIIADILTLSDHTVRDYVKSAMRKLNATTQAQAVAIGIRTGQLLP